jgi:hypothetical protein
VNAVITVGGALVGLLAALAVLLPWYRKGGKAPADPAAKGPAKSPAGGRSIKTLRPFGAGLALGIMSATCVGGALGTIAHRIGGGSNMVGDRLLSWSTGSASPAVTRHALNQLSPGGAVVLILLLVGLVIVWRGSAKRIRKDLGLGILAGCTLGPTAGLAGLAAVALVPLVNWAGNAVVGLL